MVPFWWKNGFCSEPQFLLCNCLELVTFYLWGQSNYGDSLWNQYFAMFCHLNIDAFQMMQCHPIAEKNISLQVKLITIPQVWFYNIFSLKFVTTLCNVTLDFKKAGQRLSNKLGNRVQFSFHQEIHFKCIRGWLNWKNNWLSSNRMMLSTSFVVQLWESKFYFMSLTFMLSWLKSYHRTLSTIYYMSCYRRNEFQWILT